MIPSPQQRGKMTAQRRNFTVAITFWLLLALLTRETSGRMINAKQTAELDLVKRLGGNEISREQEEERLSFKSPIKTRLEEKEKDDFGKVDGEEEGEEMPDSEGMFFSCPQQLNR